MHDIRLIRENPSAFDAGLARRGLPPASAELIALDERRRAQATAMQQDQALRNETSRQIGVVKRSGNHHAAMVLMEQVAAIKERLSTAQAEHNALEEELRDRLAVLPNIPFDSVLAGDGEADNVLIHAYGSPRAFEFPVRTHDEIGTVLGLDFETGASMSGARFTLIRGPAARLHRALGQFMLDTLTRAHGYEECVPPLLVREAALFGTGQLPKFAEDLFKAGDEHWLIPTAEVSLTNIVANKIMSADELPLRLTALTPCFRSEAGAAGRDTRGLIRQHQFEKVEMVSIVSQSDSSNELERMTRCAEGILEALELPYRRMELCTGDMGFTAAHTYDLEVWMPGQDRYREISSCSTCGEFQARRMDARYRTNDGIRHVHTLNGSGLAVGRTLAAILENHQLADGSVNVPSALRSYLDGDALLKPA